MNETPKWVARVEAIRVSATARRLFYAVLAALVLMDLLLPKKAGLPWWEALTGFSALYGFISCVLIIVVSKLVGHAGLMKRENYYD